MCVCVMKRNRMAEPMKFGYTHKGRAVVTALRVFNPRQYILMNILKIAAIIIVAAGASLWYSN